MFQIDFDPTLVSYEALLDAVWANRRGGRAHSRQYMEAVFVATSDQERAAHERVRDRAPIISGARFWLAEDYHQKYYLRHDSVLMGELAELSPHELVESTVAARLNGYVAGRGSSDQLRQELPRFGLSAAAQAHVERVVARRAA